MYLFLSSRGRFLIGPFLVLYTLGFAYAGSLTLIHSRDPRPTVVHRAARHALLRWGLILIGPLLLLTSVVCLAY